VSCSTLMLVEILEVILDENLYGSEQSVQVISDSV
jgi:hypothetical protein